MRRILSWAFVASFFFPGIAQAAPEGAPAQPPEHGVDVIAEANAGALTSLRAGATAFVPDIGFSAAWRVARRWAVGASGSLGATGFASTDSGGLPDGAWANNGTRLWKGAAFGRYDYAILGPVRAWLRGDLGLAFAHDTYDVWLHGTGLGSMSDTRIAPFVAVSTGFEVRPIEFLSIGLRAGAELLALGSAVPHDATIGARPTGVFGGLDLGFHVPMQ